jgi:hypothetical protein
MDHEKTTHPWPGRVPVLESFLIQGWEIRNPGALFFAIDFFDHPYGLIDDSE